MSWVMLWVFVGLLVVCAMSILVDEVRRVIQVTLTHDYPKPTITVLNSPYDQDAGL